MKIDPNSKLFNSIVAQLAHFAWGWLLTDMSSHWHLPFFTLSLSWAVPKEYLFDTLVEGASQLDNTIDFAFYLAGTVARKLILG